MRILDLDSNIDKYNKKLYNEDMEKKPNCVFGHGWSNG